MRTLIVFIAAVLIGIISFALYNNLTQRPVVQEIIEKPSLSGSPFSVLTPPLESLKAKVSSFTGKVKWQSRIATEAAEVKSLKEIQQGEQIETKENGSLIVEFPNVWRINISPNSKLDFAQSLPANLVIAQKDGRAQYQKLGENILSVRAMHLLIEQISGDMVITIDKDSAQVFINVKKGSATLAYNDDQNVSQVIQVKTGQRLSFDDKTREIVLR